MVRVRKKTCVVLSILLWQLQLVLPSFVIDGSSNDVDNEAYADAADVENAMDYESGINATDVETELNDIISKGDNLNYAAGNETEFPGYGSGTVQNVQLNFSDFASNMTNFNGMPLQSEVGDAFSPYDVNDVDVGKSSFLSPGIFATPSEICLKNPTLCNGTDIVSNNASLLMFTLNDDSLHIATYSPLPNDIVPYSAPIIFSGAVPIQPYSSGASELTPHGPTLDDGSLNIAAYSPFPYSPVPYSAPVALSASEPIQPYSLGPSQLTPDEPTLDDASVHIATYSPLPNGILPYSFPVVSSGAVPIQPYSSGGSRLTPHPYIGPETNERPSKIEPRLRSLSNPSDTNVAISAPVPQHNTRPETNSGDTFFPNQLTPKVSQSSFRKAFQPTRITTVHPIRRTTTRKPLFRSVGKSKKSLPTPTKDMFRSVRKSTRGNRANFRSVAMMANRTQVSRTQSQGRIVPRKQKNNHSRTTISNVSRKGRKSITVERKIYKFRPGANIAIPDMFFPFVDYF